VEANRLSESKKLSLLLCCVHGRRCAFPLEYVLETMRPLSIRPLAGAPSGVEGLAIIRGTAVPVVSLKNLILPQESSDGPASGVPLNGGDSKSRFVILKVGQRTLAISVDSVEGVGSISRDELQGLPPLLGEASSKVVESIGTHDRELLLLLRSANLVPESFWSQAWSHIG
jgi:purine-binding chemotaxis protein CheW